MNSAKVVFYLGKTPLPAWKMFGIVVLNIMTAGGPFENFSSTDKSLLVPKLLSGGMKFSVKKVIITYILCNITIDYRTWRG